MLPTNIFFVGFVRFSLSVIEIFKNCAFNAGGWVIWSVLKILKHFWYKEYMCDICSPEIKVEKEHQNEWDNQSGWILVVKRSFLHKQSHPICVSVHISPFQIFSIFGCLSIFIVLYFCVGSSGFFSTLSAFLATKWVERVAAFLHFWSITYFSILVILYFCILAILYFWVGFT